MARVPIIRETSNNAGQVGDVVDSILDEATVQLLRGPGWVLMDGRSIAGTRLAELTGLTNLPDARGVFRRAKNNGRADGSENPDGEKAIGAFESDKFGTHNHGGGSHSHNTVRFNASSTLPLSSTNPYISETGTISAREYTIRGASSTPGHGATSTVGNITTQGGTETAPKNITVNTYIRID